MSRALIPYTYREGREIILRHRNALVVRDPASNRLEIRGTECPTCHQPLRPSSPDRQFDAANHHDAYINPDYFRLLRAGNDTSIADRPPPSPVRRLVETIPPDQNQHDEIDEAGDVEFLSSTPAVQGGNRIRREAFSPNYFRTFFVEERELGRGGKGVVLLVRHEIDGCHLGHFACKRVPVGDDHAWLEKVLIEVELLAKLSHPNLVSYRHVWLEDVKLHRFGPSVACAFILQQYCNSGDLHTYIIGSLPQEATKEELKAQMRRRSKGQADRPLDSYPQRRLGLDEIFSLFKDITSGLAYLHAANYIHRDLKPSNCLLHREGGGLTCLISDFGEVQQEHVVRNSTGSTGTISYCAPEVLKKDVTGRYGNFTTKSDIFSLGMILYFMCFGHLPYRSSNTIQEELEDIEQLRAEITDWKGFQDERRERPDLPSKLYHLLKKLLSLNAAERPSANEVLIAMKSESGIESISRGPRGTAPAIGHRIQNLDSPVPPSTPVPDPVKHATSAASSHELDGHFIPSDDDVQMDDIPSHPEGGTARHRAHVMAPSQSHEGVVRASHELVNAESRDTSPQGRTRAKTPLLLPPPTTGTGGIRHNVPLSWLSVMAMLTSNGGRIGSLARFTIFVVKMMTLARPCWPFMVNLSVASPLVVLAGLDLGFHRSAIFLTGDHGMAPRDAAVATGRHMRDISTSMLLLGLHFSVLWITSRWGSLCISTHDRWTEW